MGSGGGGNFQYPIPGGKTKIGEIGWKVKEKKRKPNKLEHPRKHVDI